MPSLKEGKQHSAATATAKRELHDDKEEIKTADVIAVMADVAGSNT